MEIIDISPTVEPSMLSWPTGRPPAEHEIVDEGDVDGPRNSEWRLDSHTGAHVDAPLHWLPGSADVSRVALDACLGPCTVLGLASDRAIEADDLPPRLAPGARLLLRTANSSARPSSRTFDPSFVAVSPDAATTLAEARIALLGIDYLSVEGYGGDGAVHRALLGAGIVLLEGLDLRAVPPGDYMLSALPLKLLGGEASPVRAVLWR